VACCHVSSTGLIGSWTPGSPDPDTVDAASHEAPGCHQRNLCNETTTTTNHYYNKPLLLQTITTNTTTNTAAAAAATLLLH